MFFKVLVCLLPLICGLVWSLPCDDFKKNHVFTCDDDDKQTVKIFDQLFQCPDGSICNRNYDGVQTKCSPCITTDLICGTAYKCLTPTTFSIGLNNFSCPKDFTCNADKKTTCNPCIEKKCDPDAWKCIDETHVIISGINATCPEGQVCNKDLIHPCTPCINKPAFNIPIFFMP